MKTILSNLTDLIKQLLNSSTNAKLDVIMHQQELIMAYLGMTPGGATPEDLDALGAKIKVAKEAIQQFDSQTTNPPAV